MKRYFIWILAGLMINLLGLSLDSFAKEDTWTTKADMPTRRGCLGTTAVNGKIYAIGGWTGNFPLSSVVEEYDPEADTWTQKADMPTGRHALSTIAVNGKIYAIGGGYVSSLPDIAFSNVEEYDPATDTWTKKADMPTPRGNLSTGAVNGKIYAIGGVNASGEALATVEEYDPVTDIWTKRADMPTPICKSANNAPTVNGKIYIIGGSVTYYPESVISTVEVYDPATDTWEKKADMPTARAYMAISEVKGKIYVIGGVEYVVSSGAGDIPLGTGEYDPATDTWTKKTNMSTARAYLSASTVNGYIYAIGGLISSSLAFPTLEEYDTGMSIHVTAISPQEGRITGGEPIAIFGSGFTSEINVTIGAKPLVQMKITDTLITGLIPPGTEGEQEVRIIAPWLDYPIIPGKFFYKLLSNIIVTKMTPDNGKQAGGDVGSVIGSGFITGATVTIDGIQATDVNVTPTLITFKIPPGSEGVKDIVVTNPDGQKGTLRQAYTYNPFPIIESVKPEGGPLLGGTDTVITGSNFMQGVIVYVGDSRVNKLDFYSAKELRLKTPSSNDYSVKTVRVVNPDGQDAILEKAFSYNYPPVVKSVEPNEGTLEGGINIAITGDNFISPVRVIIGEIEAKYTSVYSPTKIVTETPPSTVGIKDIRVINGDGQTDTLENAFTYNVAPIIKTISPDNGRLAGGTKITITGSGFLPKAEVLVSLDDMGDIPDYRMASSVEVMSDTLITAIMPPNKAGIKRVVVVNRDNQRVETTFMYNMLPTISSITPNHGTRSGGTKIVIQGAGFLPGAKVLLGDRPAAVVVKNDGIIEAVTPPIPQGVYDIRIINPDTQEVVIQKCFISIGEKAYNYPNPFRASQGTTFRYITQDSIQTMTVKIFNLAGIPIDVVQGTGSNEVRWQNSDIHVGIYVYEIIVNPSEGSDRHFRGVLEVSK